MKKESVTCLICGTMFQFYRSKQKGENAKYCSRKCFHRGTKKDITWRFDKKNGYIRGWITIDGKRVIKTFHRWIMEQHLGRDLLPAEIVHHINSNRLDNRIENLKIMTRGEHGKLHNIRKVKKST